MSRKRKVFFFLAFAIILFHEIPYVELKVCTLQELIAEVTGTAPAHQTLFEFLLTYRSIVKPLELVDLIIARFDQVATDPKASVIRFASNFPPSPSSLMLLVV